MSMDVLPSDFVFAARRLADHECAAVAKLGEEAFDAAEKGQYGLAMARLEDGEMLIDWPAEA